MDTFKLDADQITIIKTSSIDSKLNIEQLKSSIQLLRTQAEQNNTQADAYQADLDAITQQFPQLTVVQVELDQEIKL